MTKAAIQFHSQAMEQRLPLALGTMTGMGTTPGKLGYLAGMAQPGTNWVVTLMVKLLMTKAAIRFHCRAMAALWPSVQGKMMAMAIVQVRHGFIAGMAQLGVN